MFSPAAPAGESVPKVLERYLSDAVRYEPPDSSRLSDLRVETGGPTEQAALGLQDASFTFEWALG